MKLSCKYFMIDAKIDPRGKWALILLGLVGVSLIVDHFTNPYLTSIKSITFMDLGYALLGAGAVKAIQYAKLREHEIQMDKELKLRHEELKCKYCDESFTFVQDWNVHLMEEEKKRSGK